MEPCLGLSTGHDAILDLFDELSDVVENSFGFANVMEVNAFLYKNDYLSDSC